ncbi:MAG: DUF5688 family protein [Eubacterium ramulus]
MEVCALYVQDLYKEYQNGWSVDSIIQEILNRLEVILESECFQRSKNLEDYEKIKDYLFIRLLNIEKNQTELSGIVSSRTTGDIALALKGQCMGELDGSSASVKIKRHMLDSWKRDSQEVFDAALLNTYFISPPRIYCWERLIFNPDYAGENFMNLMCDYKIKKDALGNCLSTTIRTNGAVAIFLPGVAERIGQLMGCGFYMVFTSIHEVMIHSERNANPKELKQVLEDTAQRETISVRRRFPLLIRFIIMIRSQNRSASVKTDEKVPNSRMLHIVFKKAFWEEGHWHIKLYWMRDMAEQIRALYIRKEKKKMIIWN